MACTPLPPAFAGGGLNILEKSLLGGGGGGSGIFILVWEDHIILT